MLTVALLVCVVAIAFESFAVYTAMPRAAAELNGLPLYAWAFTLFVLGQLFAIVTAGRVCDRIGPAWPLVAGLLTFMVGLVIGGIAPSMGVLLVGRFVQGIGAGIMNLSVMVLMAHAYPPEQRPGLMAWCSACWVMPAFFGPAVAAWITHHLGWHWVFLSVLPVVLIAGVMAVVPMMRLRDEAAPEPDPEAKPVPVWAAGVGALGVAGLQYAGQQQSGWSVAFGLAGAAMVALAVPKLLPRRGPQRGRLVQVIGVRTLGSGSFFGMEAFVPLMLVETRGLDLLQAGTALTIGSLGWVIGSWLQSQRWLRLRRDQIIRLGTGILVGGVAAIAASAWLPITGLVLTGLGLIAAGVAMGLMMSSTNLATIHLSEAHEQGRNNSSLQVGETLGNSVAAGIAGTIFVALTPLGQGDLTFGAVLTAMAVIAGLSWVVSVRMHPLVTEPDRAPPLNPPRRRGRTGALRGRA